MKFATIGHFTNTTRLNIPNEWIIENFIVSPEINVMGVKGHIIGLQLNAEKIMSQNREKIRKTILEAAIFAQEKLNVNLIQLGALTTSVTGGGVWLSQQKEYKGFVNHGDSYTALVTCQAVEKIINLKRKKIEDQTLAIVGAYGIIGEAVSKILVSQFKHTIIIGRKINRLIELSSNLSGSYQLETTLKTGSADIVVTATNHPKALLKDIHLKRKAIVIDVSQPPNASRKLCELRKDVTRIDGGYVDFPIDYHIPLPNVPKGKLFACIVEVIMQAIENDKNNHIGSIDLDHLYKTEEWSKKYGFTLNTLTNFGKKIEFYKNY